MANVMNDVDTGKHLVFHTCNFVCMLRQSFKSMGKMCCVQFKSDITMSIDIEIRSKFLGFCIKQHIMFYFGELWTRDEFELHLKI